MIIAAALSWITRALLFVAAVTGLSWLLLPWRAA
jgi:hypothetical protein